MPRPAPALLPLALLLTASPALADDPPPPPEPNHLRASLEMVLGLGAGTLWYVIDDRNVLDWDSPAIEQRFTGEAWRFDNNGFVMNALLHPLTGAGTHVLARANHIDFWPSLPYTIGTSFAWEYVIEFKEKVSINDLMVTAPGGVPIGEFFHKLGVYLHSTDDPGFALSSMQWSFGTSVAIHQALDGPPPPPKRRDALGLDADISHDFEIELAPSWVTAPSEPAFFLQKTAARGRLATLPGYLQASCMSRWFYEGEISRLELDVQQSEKGAGMNLDADLLLAGYHHQALRRHARSTSGHAATAALGLEYRFRNTSAAGFDDRQGILRMPGPVVESWVREGTLAAGLWVRAHPSFSQVSSPSFPTWRTANPDPRTKAIAEREGYFFGWGWSASVGAELGLGPLWLRSSWRVDDIDSQEGLDRAQEKVEPGGDVDLDETLIESLFEVRLHVPSTPIWAGAFLQRTQRASFAGAKRTDVRRDLQGLSLSLRF